MGLTIVPAEKIKQYARVCLWGVEKSGKTHTALMLATALAGEGGKVVVISSEYGSSKLLSRKFPHDIVDLTAPDEFGNAPKNPFAPERYEEAIKLCVKAGYQAIVIDSLSHSWAGEGGTLQAVGKAGFTDGWGKNTPIYDHLVNTILAPKCHVIVTLRAKDKYEQKEYLKKDNTVGKAPENIGEAPVMRKGFGYEMQLTIRMDSMTAHIQSSAVEEYIPKGEEIEKPTAELAYRLLDALDGAEIPEPTPQELAILQHLAEFKTLYAGWCNKTPQWQQTVLRKALDIKEGEALPMPAEYTDDDVYRVGLYVTSEKQKKQNKAS